MVNQRLNQLLEMLTESPDDAFILYAIATEYKKVGENEKALLHYKKLVDEQPNYVGTYYHYAALLAETGSLENAAKTYEMGIKIATELKDHHSLAELKNAYQNFNIEYDI